MKHVSSLIGWPSMPSALALAHFTASSAPLVAFAPITIGPPCWLKNPIFTGDSFGFAAPDLPPTYLTNFVTAAGPRPPPTPAAVVFVTALSTNASTPTSATASTSRCSLLIASPLLLVVTVGPVAGTGIVPAGLRLPPARGESFARGGSSPALRAKGRVRCGRGKTVTRCVPGLPARVLRNGIHAISPCAPCGARPAPL